MKYVLVMWWMVVYGSSNPIAIHSIRFNSLEACDAIKQEFLTHKISWSSRHAVCVRDVEND